LHQKCQIQKDQNKIRLSVCSLLYDTFVIGCIA